MKKLERADFGPNTWLIDEMHRAYVDDPASVGEAWQEFFADYQPRTPLRQAAPAAPPEAAPVAPPPPPEHARLLPGRCRFGPL